MFSRALLKNTLFKNKKITSAFSTSLTPIEKIEKLKKNDTDFYVSVENGFGGRIPNSLLDKMIEHCNSKKKPTFDSFLSTIPSYMLANYCDNRGKPSPFSI